MLKPLRPSFVLSHAETPAPRFCPDLCARLIDIADKQKKKKKQVPAKLNPIVALSHVTSLRHGGVLLPALRAARRMLGNVCTLGSSVTA